MCRRPALLGGSPPPVLQRRGRGQALAVPGGAVSAACSGGTLRRAQQRETWGAGRAHLVPVASSSSVAAFVTHGQPRALCSPFPALRLLPGALRLGCGRLEEARWKWCGARARSVGTQTQDVPRLGARPVLCRSPLEMSGHSR